MDPSALGLRCDPFLLNDADDPEFFASAYASLISDLLVGVESDRGVCVVVGSVATDVSLVAASLAARTPVSIVAIGGDARVESAPKFVQRAIQELGGEADGDLDSDLSTLAVMAENEGCLVLIVDHAEAWPAKTIERLGDLFSASRSAPRGAQLFLLGSLDLLDRLNAGADQGLIDHVLQICRIPPLSDGEARALLGSRIRAAGSSLDALFTREALTSAVSGGAGSFSSLLNLVGLSARHAISRGERTISGAAVAAAISGEVPDSVDSSASLLDATPEELPGLRAARAGDRGDVAPSVSPSAGTTAGISPRIPAVEPDHRDDSVSASDLFGFEPKGREVAEDPGEDLDYRTDGEGDSDDDWGGDEWAVDAQPEVEVRGSRGHASEREDADASSNRSFRLDDEDADAAVRDLGGPGVPAYDPRPGPSTRAWLGGALAVGVAVGVFWSGANRVPNEGAVSAPSTPSRKAAVGELSLDGFAGPAPRDDAKLIIYDPSPLARRARPEPQTLSEVARASAPQAEQPAVAPREGAQPLGGEEPDPRIHAVVPTAVPAVKMQENDAHEDAPARPVGAGAAAAVAAVANSRSELVPAPGPAAIEVASLPRRPEGVTAAPAPVPTAVARAAMDAAVTPAVRTRPAEPSAPASSRPAPEGSGAVGPAFTVQIGAYREAVNAERALDQLRSKFNDGRIVRDGEFFRVVSGSFPDRNAALTRKRSLDGARFSTYVRQESR